MKNLLEDFEVEEIIDKRVIDGTVYYKVIFLKDCLDQTSWEPAININEKAVIK